MSANLTPLISVSGTFEERVQKAANLDLSDFRRRFQSKQVSTIVDISIHNQCNLECNHCFQREDISGTSSSSSVSRAGRILDFLDSSENKVLLFPREPLMYPPVLALYESTGCQEVSTNALLVAERPGLLRTLHERGIRDVLISLHGLSEAHCTLTNMSQKDFDKLLKAIRAIVADGFNVEITTTLYKNNISSLDDLPELLIDLGVSKWWIQRIVPCGYAKDWSLENFFYGDECEDVICKYAQLKARYKRDQISVGLDLTWGPNFFSRDMLRFLAGQVQRWPWTKFSCPAISGHRIAISADSGNIYPCIFFETFPESQIGYLQSDLSPIVEKRPFDEVTLSENLRGQCADCSYKEYCLGGCRTVAFSFAKLLSDSAPFFAGQDFCLTKFIEKDVSE